MDDQKCNMWLLSTRRAELRFFPSPENVPDGYTILSHVWGSDETTFQEVQALYDRCKKTGDSPRDFVQTKVRQACILAERHGFSWIWIDTCCIDKTSSAELSEAINSMFRFYALSRLCYAFLEDVPFSSTLADGTRSEFRKSRWYTRGWTLQELIAPKFVIFLSVDWRALGTKADLAELVEEITGVPGDVLRYQKNLADISIARRMSWAATRETTRIEDQAYSLMGIFGINMPTLYGEGAQAFYRLQEEIMKTSIDTSLFAWEIPDNMRSHTEEGQTYTARRRVEAGTHDHFDPFSYLLAPSPGLFKGSRIDFDGEPAHPQTVNLARLWLFCHQKLTSSSHC